MGMRLKPLLLLSEYASVCVCMSVYCVLIMCVILNHGSTLQEQSLKVCSIIEYNRYF